MTETDSRSLLTLDQALGHRCVDCGSEDAPHRGELQTVRVSDGVVSADHAQRCTPCLAKHRAGVAR